MLSDEQLLSIYTKGLLARPNDDVAGTAWDTSGLRAVEAAVRADQAVECNNVRFELLRELAAAQAVIAEAQACLGQADQGDSFGPIEDILSQSSTDALQAHDRQVAAKAVRARSADYLKVAAEAVREQFQDDPDVLSRSLRDIAIKLRDMVHADRAAAIVSEPSTREGGE